MEGTARRQFSVSDYVVFVLSLMVCLAIGVYHAVRSRNKQSTSNFLMGGRDLKVLPLTVSLVVSVVSAVTLLGLPAEMYTQGSQYFFNIGSGIGIVLTALVFVPLLHPLKLTSMFEYLERRFDSKAARLTGSMLHVLSMLLYGGTALYAPVVALEGVTPIPTWQLALALGILVTLYTSLGGLKAVVWTDVFQAIIMLGGIAAVLIQGVVSVGGFSEVWRLNKEGGRLEFYDFDPDPTTRMTFWGLTIGFSFGGLSFYGASQFTFQRFTATKTLRDAKLTVLLNLPAFYIFHILLCVTGLIIYAYYAMIECDPIASKVIRSSNQLLPLFVLDTLGFLPGLPGLFVAALTSGALSTISSVMNAIAALIWEDLLKTRLSFLSQFQGTLVNRITVFICGAIIVGITFMADSFGPHIFQVCFAFLGASGGPQLGLFILAAFIPWVNWKGAISGCVSSLLLMIWITIGVFLTRPPQYPLPPGPVDQCLLNNVTLPVSSNMTTVIEPSGISKLYTLSYTWNTALGCTVCVLIGVIVSAFTERCNPDPKLVLPVYSRLKCCLKYCYGKQTDDSDAQDEEEQAMNENVKLEKAQEAANGEVSETDHMMMHEKV